MYQLFISFIEIKFLDILDIILVAFLLYELYNLLKGTVAINIFFGIIAFYLLWKLVTALEMRLLSEIFGAFISVGFIALIVVFQPEIRQFLLRLGTPGFISRRRKKFLFWRFDVNHHIDLDLGIISLAVKQMSESKTGALILITNQSDLEQFSETGERVNADISDSLIESIFFKNNPLHDGAVIIHHNKIKAARCILPVSNNGQLPARYGLRHRAALGATEQSDAVAIIVSEETGEIAIAIEDRLQGHVKPVELKAILREYLK